MNSAFKQLFRYASIALCLGLLAGALAVRADVLDWKKSQDKVDASIDDANLVTFLEKLANVTGWRIYVEPGTKATISAKFKNLTPDEALRRLLANINYARKETYGISELYVYRTDAHAATQLIKTRKAAAGRKSGRIPNELIIQLKRDSKLSIEELAAKLHAKILGRDDRLKLYRLGFDDAAAADAARQTLAATDGVGAVDSNYAIDRPNPNEMVTSGNSLPIDPKVMPKGSQFVGLVDTGVQNQPNLGNYLLPGEDVAGGERLPTDTPTHGTTMMESMLQTMGNYPSKVMDFDVYGTGEMTTTFDVAEGVMKAVNAGANPINLSLGGPDESALLHQVIMDAYSKGIVFVAAAGNEPTTAPTYPAAWKEVLAVTAGMPNGQIAPYANSGSFVNAIAPGTSYVPFNGQTWVVEGTSVSTAYITGLIVNKMNQDGLTARQAEAALLASPPPGLIVRHAK